MLHKDCLCCTAAPEAPPFDLTGLIKCTPAADCSQLMQMEDQVLGTGNLLNRVATA